MGKKILIFLIIFNFAFAGVNENLFFSIEKNDINGVKLAIKNGAKLDIKDKHGQSPLLLSLKDSKLEIVKYLVEKGANIREKNQNMSMIQWTVFLSQEDIEDFLMMKGGAIPLNNKNYSVFLEIIKNNSEEVKKLIKQNPKLVDYEDELKRTPLFYSILMNNFELTKFLIENGANLDKQDMYKKTPFYFCIRNNNSMICQYLIDNGAGIEEEILPLGKPLEYALYYNSQSVLKTLIENNARLSDEYLNKGAINNSKESLEIFINEMRVQKIPFDLTSALFDAVLSDSKETIKLFFEFGADKKSKNSNGEGLLEYAMSSETRKFLLSLGVKW